MIRRREARCTAFERHHLLPKQHLEKLGITGVRDINQIGNMALLEWADNIAISDAPPARYWSKYAERFDIETLTGMMQWHALPADWWTMNFEQFLAARRAAHCRRDSAGVRQARRCGAMTPLDRLASKRLRQTAALR